MTAQAAETLQRPPLSEVLKSAEQSGGEDYFHVAHENIAASAFAPPALRSTNYEPTPPWTLNNVVGRLLKLQGRLDHAGLELADSADFLFGALKDPAKPLQFDRPGDGVLTQLMALVDRLERASDRIENQSSRISGGLKQPGETLNVFD